MWLSRRARPGTRRALQIYASASFSRGGRGFELPGHGTFVALLGSVGCRAPSPPVTGQQAALCDWPLRGSTLTPTLHVGVLGLLSHMKTRLFRRTIQEVSVSLCCALAFSGGAMGACSVVAHWGQGERQSRVSLLHGTCCALLADEHSSVPLIRAQRGRDAGGRNGPHRRATTGPRQSNVGIRPPQRS